MQVKRVQILSALFMTFLTTTFGKKTSRLFFKRHNKRLVAHSIKTVNVSNPDQCLGVCLYDLQCNSFNAENTKCELFAQDRCFENVTLVENTGTSYFDTVPDGRCSPGKLSIIFSCVR